MSKVAAGKKKAVVEPVAFYEDKKVATEKTPQKEQAKTPAKKVEKKTPAKKQEESSEEENGEEEKKEVTEAPQTKTPAKKEEKKTPAKKEEKKTPAKKQESSDEDEVEGEDVNVADEEEEEEPPKKVTQEAKKPEKRKAESVELKPNKRRLEGATVVIGHIKKKPTEDEIRSILPIEPVLVTIPQYFKHHVFVDFSTPEEATKILSMNPETSLGKLEFKTPLPREYAPRKICVQNLPEGSDEESLKKLFLEHGQITELYIVSPRNGLGPNRAYIEFVDDDTVESVINKKISYEGQLLMIEKALQRSERSLRKLNEINPAKRGGRGGRGGRF